MAWMALDPEDAALARSMGAAAKYKSPVFMVPKAKPKPRPELRGEEPELIVATDAENKRKVDDVPLCSCTCKVRRLVAAITDLEKRLLGVAAKQN